MSAWYVGYTPQLATAVMMAKSNKNGNMVTLEGTSGMSQRSPVVGPARVWDGVRPRRPRGPAGRDLPDAG